MTFTAPIYAPIGVTQREVELARLVVAEHGCGTEVLQMLGIAPEAETTNNRARRLTPDSVRAIRRLHTGGLTYGRIAERYGISVPTVQSVVKRKTWRHVA